MKPHPKVSICIPSYNHARFLPSTIDSALSQTYRNTEIIIVDDGSLDGSLQIAESYAAKYPASIRVFTHPNHRNKGISATINLAFEKSTGDYWSVLGSDDILYPDKVEAEVEILEKRKDLDWVYSDVHYIDETGLRMADRFGLFGVDISLDANPLERLILRNVIPAMTVLARREAVEKAGQHDESLIYSDWEFWIRLLTYCKVSYINRPLVKYRIHSYNTSLQVKAEENIKRVLDVLTSLRRKAPAIGGAITNPRIQALIELQRSLRFFYLKDEAEAARCIRSACEADPLLHKDTEYLARWIRSTWDGIGLSNWIVEQLSKAAGSDSAELLEKRMRGWTYAKAAIEYYQLRDLPRTRKMILRSLFNTPHDAGTRLLISMLAETLIGSKMMGRMRHLKRGTRVTCR